jgi:hypothetical protein
LATILFELVEFQLIKYGLCWLCHVAFCSCGFYECHGKWSKFPCSLLQYIKGIYMSWNPVSFVENTFNAVADVGQSVVNGVLDVGKSLDQVVRDTIPGGWTTVGLVAGGYSLMNAADAAAAEAAGQGTAIASTGAATDSTISAVQNYLAANPGLTTEQIAQVAAENGISAAQIAQATGVPVSAVESAFADLGTATGADLSAAYDMGEIGSLGAGGPIVGGTALSSMTPAAAAAAAAAGATGGNALSNALIAGTVASTIGGIANANAAKDAAQTQADAAKAAQDQQLSMFNTINAQQAPYRAAGYNALNQIGSLGSGTYQKYDENGKPIGTGTGSDYLTHQFNATDLAKGLAPNYDFMLQQGQMANQRAANVGGGALSGNTLQGLQKFTQDYAGNAYQNAFNNYQTQRSNIYNTLAGIAGIGQTGQNATNTAAQNATNAYTQLGVGSAAAQAAGTIGQTNAYTNAINNAVNNYTLASLLQQGGRVAG